MKRNTGSQPRYVPTVGFPFDAEFLVSKSICPVGDKGPGASPNPKFTSLCGHEIFRGNALPKHVYEDLFIADPTIHVIRRANVDSIDGKVMFSNADAPDEFLLSPDFNFRPVSTHTGPDGCLYVVDMYRGIIQDEPWFNDASKAYAREKGFNEHVQRGRIWRIRHKDHEPRPVPKMLQEPVLALLRHFHDDNGWIRDTAQKLVILRAAEKEFPSATREQLVASLEAMVRYQPDRPLARLHALWTLEGLGELDRSLIESSLSDRDPRIQAAAIQLGEEFIRNEDTGFYDELNTVAARSAPVVGKQLVMSLGWSQSERAAELIHQAVRRHITDKGVFLAAMASLWGREDSSLIRAVRDGSVFASVKDVELKSQLISQWNTGLAAWNFKQTHFPKEWTTKQKWLAGGERVYFDYCARCHGPDGKGLKLPGHDLLVAPPLAGSPRVKGDPDKMIRILLHGLTGPVNGQAYAAGVMPRITALGQDDKNRITQVANFVRYAWGNDQLPIAVEDVEKVMEETRHRRRAYTLDELGLDSGAFVNKELQTELLNADPQQLANDATLHGDAVRGKEIFYSRTVACFTCHDPPAGAFQLGPDLKKVDRQTTVAEIVDSILRPSKKIKKDYAQTVVITAEGKSVTGLRVSQTDDEIVIRSTADGKKIHIAADNIDDVVDSDVSLMPGNLVTQLKDRGEFYDLVRFLTSLNPAGE